MSKLKFTGSKVPSDPSSVPGAVADIAALCVAEGATDLVVPDRPLPFKDLTAMLTEKGIFKVIDLKTSSSKSKSRSGSKNTDSSTVPGDRKSSSSSSEEMALAGAHREQV